MFSLGSEEKDQELREKLADYFYNDEHGLYLELAGSYYKLPEGYKYEYRDKADEILKIISDFMPRCEDCGKEIEPGTGLEKDKKLTPLCYVCQTKRMSYKNG
jgi:hypothetical protein